MVLNYIWIGFFLIAFVIALVRMVFWGDMEVFPAMMNSTFDTSKTAFDISLGLTGVLSLWLGVMKIGERGGVINVLSRLLSPIFVRLFPDIPKGHPVTGSIFMNIAANMLGLDNAATPLGLKAMEQMNEVKDEKIEAIRKEKGLSDSQVAELKATASNPMIMFLVLNTSGLTLIPVSILVYRAQLGAAQPTDVFIPILLATFFSTIAGAHQPHQPYNAAHAGWHVCRGGRYHLGILANGQRDHERGEHVDCQHPSHDHHHPIYISGRAQASERL